MPTPNLLEILKNRAFYRGVLILPSLVILSSPALGAVCASCGPTKRTITISDGTNMDVYVSGAGVGPAKQIQVQLKPETPYVFSLTSPIPTVNYSWWSRVSFGCALKVKASYANPYKQDLNFDEATGFDIYGAEGENNLLDPQTFTLLISEGENSEGGNSQRNSGAALDVSPPGYNQSNPAALTLSPATAQMEIRVGEIAMGVNGTAPYRSAGLLAWYGPLSGGLATPGTLEYLGVDDVKGRTAVAGDPGIPAKVVYGSVGSATGFPNERHLVTPTRLFRVTGYNTTPETIVTFATAPSTYVREYVRGSSTEAASVTLAAGRQPVSWWKIQPYGTGGVSVEKSVEGELMLTTFDSPSANGFVKTEGILAVETTLIPISGTAYSELEIARRSGIDVSKTLREYEFIGGAARMIRESRYPDPASNANPVVTQYGYYHEGADLPGGTIPGQTRWISYPDGNWEYYQHSSYSTVILSPFASETFLDTGVTDQSLPPIGGTGRCKQVINFNSGGSMESVVSDPYGSNEIITSNTSQYSYSESVENVGGGGDGVFPDGVPLIKEYTGGLSWELSYSSSIEQASEHRWLADEPVLSSDGNGKVKFYQYQKNGSLIMKTVTSGIVNSEPGNGVLVGGEYFHEVPNLSDRVIRTYGPNGLATTERLYHTGSGFSSASIEQVVYDAAGKYVSTSRNGIIIETVSHPAPYTEVKTDEQGRQTTTVRNAQGENVSVTVSADGGVPEQITSYVISGLTTTTLTNGVVTNVTTMDGLGRVVSSKDQTNALTSYSYLDGGRTTETLLPGGLLRREVNYWDGRIMAVSGNAAVNEFYTYDTQNAAPVIKSHSTGSAVAHTLRLTISEYDVEGKLTRTVTPSPSVDGGQVEHVSDYLDDQLMWIDTNKVGTPLGSLSRRLFVASEQSSEGAARVFEAERIEGYDIDHDYQLALGTVDRFTKETWSYVLVGGVVYRQTLSHSYPDGTEANRQTSTRLESLGFVPAMVGGQDPGYAEVQEVIDPSGRSLKTTRQTFPSSATVITTVDDSATKETGGTPILDSVTTSVNGYVQNVRKAGTAKVETYAYDGFGRIKQYTDIRGASTWSFFYNGSFQVEKVTNHLGQTATYSYYLPTEANAGLLKITTNPVGAYTQTAYNERGQVTETSGTAGYRQINGYDQFGDRTTLQTFGTQQAITRWVFQPSTGLLSAKRYNDAANTGVGYLYQYTPDGKMSKRTSARGVVTDYIYDPATRDLTNVNYSGDANLTPDLTYSLFDHFGRPGKVDELLAGVTNSQTLTYQPYSGAVSTVYATNHKWLPGVKVQRGTDDASGRPSGFDTLIGSVSQTSQGYQYDTLSRLGGVSSGDLNAAISYLPGTENMQEQTVSIGGQVVHQRGLVVDLLGRTVGVTNKAPVAGIGTSLTTVASVGHAYDTAGRRDNARREDGTWWDYDYHPTSEVKSAIKMTATDALVPGLSYSYQYDGIGNRTSATFGTAPNVATLGYTPDALNRYTTLTHPRKIDILTRSDATVTATATGATVNSVTAVGNLQGTRLTATASTGGRAVTTSLNRAGTLAGTVKSWVPAASLTPTYDLDGNLTGDGRWTYTWDGENRLVSLVSVAAAVTNGAPNVDLFFAYDHRGRRIGKTILDKAPNPDVYTYLSYAYDQWNPVAEWQRTTLPGALSLSNLKRSHVWGLDIGSQGKASGEGTNFQAAGGVAGLISSAYHNSATSKDRFIPGYDANGNIISWTGSNGATLQLSDYDPFGNTVLVEKIGNAALVAKLPDYGFSTKPNDAESGLYYYGYRYYDPVTGRWPSRDPIEEEGGVNLYGFVGNDGVNKWDILGNSPVSSFRGAEMNIPSVVYGSTATFGGINSFWIKVQGDGEFSSNEWVFKGMPFRTSGVTTRTFFGSSITSVSGVTIWKDRSGVCPVECAFYELHRSFNNTVSIGWGAVSITPGGITWEEKLWVEVCANGVSRKGQYTKNLTATWGGARLSVSYK